MMAAAAYMTRGIQLMFGSSKRAMVERAEELRTGNDEIPMTTASSSAAPTATMTSSQETVAPTETMVELQSPPRSRDSLPTRQQHSRNSSPETEGHRTELPAQIPAPPPRARRWALLISSNINIIIYVFLFLFVGIPIYYTIGYEMPLHLTLTVLTYFAASSLPPKWLQYLHPVLVSSLLSVLGLWITGLTKAQPLSTTLHQFRTGTTYLALRGGQTRRPGAGDVFASVLDAGIAALALPMYRHRRSLRQHFAAVVVPNLALAAASLFAYPYVCFAIGIGPERSLAFTARSLTLALALPAVANLGGDANTVAALAIASGIVGVAVGGRMLGLLRIPEGMFFLSFIDFAFLYTQLGGFFYW